MSKHHAPASTAPRFHRSTAIVPVAAAMVSLLLAGAPSSHSQSPANVDKAEVTKAINRALDYLDKHQKDNGFWSSSDFPGLTGLVVQAYLAAPGGAKRPAAERGLDFIRSKARPDGGIYTDRMANYNTAVSLTALLRAGNPKDRKVIDAAHTFLVGGQITGASDSAENGGFGYDPAKPGKPARPDLDNTVFAMEASKLYQEMTRDREIPRSKQLDWKAAIDFVTRCQQLPSHNKQPWVSKDQPDQGGFVYLATGNSKEPLRSYGTMTYAGVLSFIYADLKRDDPRLTAAREWLTRHYTLDENPGQGEQGLYYYYHLMAKGLTALQLDALQLADGKKINWPAQLAAKLISLQKPDGSWVNTNGRWMENNPDLVTAYSVLALSYALEKL